MLFTPEQIQELNNIIRRNTVVFVAANFGQSALSLEDRLYAYDAGIDLRQYGDSNQLMVAYQFGRLSELVGETEAKKLTFADVKELFQAGALAPLTESELQAIKTLTFQTYASLKDQQAKITNDLNTNLAAISADTQAERTKFEQQVTSQAKLAAAKRETARDLARRLRTAALGQKQPDGKIKGGWLPDFDRMADTVMHNAFDQGRANFMKQNYGGDPDVYKDVYQGACSHCIRLYLTGGIGSEPKIFKLSELEANGTNMGRKPQDWKPVIGGVHPFCRCTTNVAPRGTVWNKETKQFEYMESKTELGEKIRQKVKISY